MASLEARHDHDTSGGAMVMTAGVPGLFYMQQIFWAFVGTAIAVATLANVFNKILCYQRIAASRNSSQPAKPKNIIFQIQATTAAIIREFSYYSPPISIKKWRVFLPTAGPATMLVGYIVLIVVTCLYRLNPADLLQWEDIGYRSGFIAICQIPLIVLLGGKRNILGALTGAGYERFNWLHRWVARALLFTVFIHMGFWMTEWAKFDYILIKFQTDPLTQRGIAAGVILVWIIASSCAPIRGLSYEFFVVQHIISYVGFLVAMFFHVPAENQIWLWIPIGIWLLDRVVRAGYLFYNNMSILHRNSSGLLACRATFEALDESHTRITIANPPVTWKAGQHMFLACHPVAPLSSHPFTIASLPEDGKLEFVVRAKKGATKRFFKYAAKTHPSLPGNPGSQDYGRGVLIDGPYARMRPLRQFDSVVLVAGSTGATFCVPLMRDIVQQWTGTSSSRKFSLEPAPGAVTRHIKLVWCLKKSASVSWFGWQLDQVVHDVEQLRNSGHDVAVEISIYVTCDDGLTSEQSSVANGIEGNPRIRDASESTSTEKEKEKAGTVQQISSRTSSVQDCCCTRVVEEDEVTAPCTCGERPGTKGGSSISSYAMEKSNRLIDDRIQILSGRPNIPNIVRKTAELALGEMAVVVCGPPSMVQGTRNAVVAISDDRGVHKGTGAQGIYVHAEAFGYA